MATFGDTSLEASTSTSSSSSKISASASPASSGTVVSMSFYLAMGGTTPSATVRGVIYSNSAGLPSALLAQTDSQVVTSTSQTQYTLNFSGANLISVTGGTTYFVGIWWTTPTGTTPTIGWARGSTANSADKASDTNAGPASTWGTNSTITGPISVFVTYTPSAGTTPSSSTIGLMGVG